MNKTLSGPMAARYYPDPRYRLTWSKAEGITNYWLVHYNKVHVAELYKGKSGYIGVIFGKGSFSCRDGKEAALHVSGLVLNKNH